MKRPVAVAVAAAVLMSLATIEQADAADGPAASAAVLACAVRFASESSVLIGSGAVALGSRAMREPVTMMRSSLAAASSSASCAKAGAAWKIPAVTMATTELVRRNAGKLDLRFCMDIKPSPTEKLALVWSPEHAPCVRCFVRAI